MTRPELGVCWYPEHWPEADWEPDARRMRALGLAWVRIGEFAWSWLEPSPGELRFERLDRALDALHDAGLRVVLGTPTATPPKWLVDRMPDMLPVDAQGRRLRFGSRRHYCPGHEGYRQETERIVGLLVERYGDHPGVGAWQTDNELGHHGTTRCWCDGCARRFRAWLERRYGTVEALNEAWWTLFWSQRYRAFDEVEPPNLTVVEPNPSHSLDYFRFASEQLIEYHRVQTRLIRAGSPGRVLLHNGIQFYDEVDWFALGEDLDVLAWDSYPVGLLEQSPLPVEVKERYLRVGHPDLTALQHELFRGATGRTWVMEQQPGQVNWAPSNPLPARGAVRLWTHQAFDHGAEVVAYFRWRAALGAQELMHGGLNAHDGREDVASDEVRAVATELPDRPDAAPAPAPIALVFDIESLWATGLQPHAEGWSYWGLLLAWYAAMRALGQDVDVVPPDRDLSPYRIALAPALHLVDDARADALRAWVEAGGTLALGPRSGAKTPSNVAHAPAPGPLRSLAGVRVARVDSLRPGWTERLDARFDPERAPERFSYGVWADLLEPDEGTRVLARYRCDVYDGAAAVTERAAGRGRCLYAGAWAEPACLEALFARLLGGAGLEPVALPEGVRLTRRFGAPRLVSFASEPRDTPWGRVPPYGVLAAGETAPEPAEG